MTMTNKETVNDVYGWYDNAEQPKNQPSYDPGFYVPCLYCGEPLTDDNVRTHSFSAMTDGSKSYYYRTHRTCDEQATEKEKTSIWHAVMQRIEKDGN